jgi:hypothetical protein
MAVLPTPGSGIVLRGRQNLDDALDGQPEGRAFTRSLSQVAAKLGEQ